MSILLLGCTTWTLTKRIEKKLDRNCIRMLQAILKQRLIKQQLYDHRPPISKTIQIRRTSTAGDILLWTPSRGYASIGWSKRTYQQQLCLDTWYSLEDLPYEMDDERESGKSVLAAWRWWWSNEILCEHLKLVSLTLPRYPSVLSQCSNMTIDKSDTDVSV